MNIKVHKLSAVITLSLLLLLNLTSAGQVTTAGSQSQAGDSLSLQEIIEKVVTTYPTVRAAGEAITNAEARIGMAKSGYNPEIDFTAAYSNIGPVVKLTIPDMGTFQLYPDNNYSAGVNVRQTIYDFGRTKTNVSLETENKSISEQNLEQVKQKLSMMAVANFYTLSFLQEAIIIKQEELDALYEHLSYVEKKIATGSSTEFEELTTKVRISAVESQEVDLKAALTNQQSILNSLLGNDQSERPVVRTEIAVDVPVMPADSVLSYAYHNRDEMLINQKKMTAAEIRYDLVNTQNKPSLSFIASGGAKNGYIPDLNKLTPNYVVGLGLRVPIYDASRTKYNRLQARSAIASAGYESDFTRRNISTEVSEAQTAMFAAKQKLNQYQLQLAQALKALSLAEIRFEAGTITNLDLLDTNTSVSESRLLLLKARIDYAASVYKLKAAMGSRLY